MWCKQLGNEKEFFFKFDNSILIFGLSKDTKLFFQKKSQIPKLNLSKKKNHCLT